LGAVGRLQFDVVQFRLEVEYGVRTVAEPLSFEMFRWIDGDWDSVKSIYWAQYGRPVEDDHGNLGVLLQNERSMNFLLANNKGLTFLERRPGT
jgi:peptide chain release factor 3